MQKDNHLDARPKEVGPGGPILQVLDQIFALLNGHAKG
nr:MAG TPA: hypothetical protein [Caudoviricetes sp.]